MDDVRLTLRQAVKATLTQGGIQQLGDSYRFEACIRDLADKKEPATRAFVQNVDPSLLAPLLGLENEPSRESLNRAYAQTAQILTDDRLISEEIAFEVAGALVGGVADFLNVPYDPPNLRQAAVERTTKTTHAPAPTPTPAPAPTPAPTPAPAPTPVNLYGLAGTNAVGPASGNGKAKRIAIPIVVGVASGLAIAGALILALHLGGIGNGSSSSRTSTSVASTDSSSGKEAESTTSNESEQNSSLSSSSSAGSSSSSSAQEKVGKSNGVWVATRVEEWDYYNDGSDNHDVYTCDVDGGGNLTTPGVTYSYRYTDDGKLMELSETNDGNTIFRTYTHDSAGRITQERRTYSNDSCVRTYEFDEDGFVTAQHCSDEDGSFTATFKNERDSQGRVTKVTIRGVNDQTGEVKCERTEQYTYDKNNNIEKIDIEDTRYRDDGPRTITAHTERSNEYVSNPAPWLAELQTISKTGEPTTIF